ncbi:restriction endonuclease subunit S [Megamonas hypermegale]|uniref:restriction endonuclease subunit S n=1 Tax=Megamonas hypermegale TaxID=158847 RepID=UPI00255C43BC|nr:restriction endonuclease subunit S [Megamonas hypermegale]
MHKIFKERYSEFLRVSRGVIDLSSENLVKTVLIILRVKKELIKRHENNLDEHQLYEIMNDVSKDIQPFNITVDAFYKIFYIAKDIFTDDEDLLNIIQNCRMVMYVSPALEDIFINAIERSKAKSVLIFGIEGFSKKLLEVVKKHKDIEFSFMMNVDNYSCYMLLKEIYKNINIIDVDSDYVDAISNVKFINEKIYKYGYHNNAKYDLIIAVPKFGTISDTFLRSQMIANSWDLMVTEILLKSLNEKGVLKVVVTPKIIFSGGIDSKFRKYLLENYKLLEIADLPAGLFNNVTMVKTVLLTLSTGASDKIQVKKYVSDRPLARNTECTSLNIDKEETISIEELQADDSWNISLLLESDDEVAQYKNTGLPMVKLKDIADVFRGKAVSKLDSGKKVGVINIADITDNEIDYDKVSFVNDEQQKIIKYLLEDGDILISSRGTTIKVAMFEKQDEQYIPAVNFNVIRIHESAKSKIKSEYLKIFFASSIGQKLLASLQRGGVVMNINAKDLYSLNIPLLSLQEQQKIINQYNEEFAKYKRTLKQITDKWNNVKENIDHIFITKRE